MRYRIIILLILILILESIFLFAPVTAQEDWISKYIGKSEGELFEMIKGNRIKASLWYPYTYIKEDSEITDIIKMNYVAIEYKDKILVFQFLNNICIGCNYTRIISYHSAGLTKLKRMTLAQVLKRFGQPYSRGIYDITGSRGTPGRYCFFEYLIDKPDTYLAIYFDPVNNKVVSYKIHYEK